MSDGYAAAGDAGGAPSNASAKPTAMQFLAAEISSLTQMAGANLDVVAAQRQRLMGDLPVEARATPECTQAKALGGPVSFGDVNAALDRLRGVLLTINEHVLSMRKIG